MTGVVYIKLSQLPCALIHKRESISLFLAEIGIYEIPQKARWLNRAFHLSSQYSVAKNFPRVTDLMYRNDGDSNGLWGEFVGRFGAARQKRFDSRRYPRVCTGFRFNSLNLVLNS